MAYIKADIIEQLQRFVGIYPISPVVQNAQDFINMQDKQLQNIQKENKVLKDEYKYVKEEYVSLLAASRFSDSYRKMFLALKLELERITNKTVSVGLSGDKIVYSEKSGK